MTATLRFLLGLACAVTAHVLGLRLHPASAAWVDPFLVLVIYHSLRHGAVGSALGGTAAGLVHDALTGGLYGLHGFADTLIAFVSARVRQRLVIQQPLQVGTLCLLAAALQQVVLASLQFSLVRGAELPSAADTVVKMLSTGVLGMVIFVLAGRAREWERRRRHLRRRKPRLDT